MTISINTSGAQSSTTSEVVVATVTDAGVFILSINTENMTDGDEIQVKIYKKVDVGGSLLLFLKRSFVNAQGDGATTDAEGEVIKDSIPIPSPESFSWTIEKIKGTNRSYDWAIYEL